MKFTHHVRSGLPLNFDPSLGYPEQVPHPKPVGFWLSVDDDWERWIKDEGWGEDWLDAPPVEFEIVDMDRVLFLETVEELDAFTYEYAADIPESLADSMPHRADYWKFYMIDWARVAAEYAGIVIAPYQWSRRNGGWQGGIDFSLGWYYGWDCASGCIWDLSVLKVRDPQD